MLARNLLSMEWWMYSAEAYHAAADPSHAVVCPGHISEAADCCELGEGCTGLSLSTITVKSSMDVPMISTARLCLTSVPRALSCVPRATTQASPWLASRVAALQFLLPCFTHTGEPCSSPPTLSSLHACRLRVVMPPALAQLVDGAGLALGMAAGVQATMGAVGSAGQRLQVTMPAGDCGLATSAK